MWKQRVVAFVCLVCLALLSACGGGSGQVGGSPLITRVNDATFSSDAKILAARVAVGVRLPADKVAMFDADLARIRTQYPQVSGIHALSHFALNDVEVAVGSGAPWRSAWEQGTLTTGDAHLDNLLSDNGASSVHLLTADSSTEWFLVTFDASLNITAILEPLKSANVNVVDARPDALVGDGDDIQVQEAGGVKSYGLSHGWGDCPVGCISRHTWTFTIGTSGAISLSESGSAIPVDGGRGESSARANSAPSPRSAVDR